MQVTLGLYEIIALILAGLLLIVGIYFAYRRLARSRQQRKIRKIIRKISSAYLKDISLDMGEDQYAYFDYILLNKDGILVLEFKDYAGHIFASEQINEWTQVIAGKSYKFANPFFELERKIEILRQVIPGQVINALIFFTDSADFPKGRPQNVLLLGELSAHFGKANAEDVSETDKSAWLQLKTYMSAGN
jgi:hypothetical protein